MLTPIEIQGKVFKTGIGYDKKDVESFLKEVLQSFEQLYKENVELNDKIGVLSEGIQYYKTIEKTLQKALILAEKTAEDTKNAAEKEAKAIKEKANAKAKMIIGDAKSELDQIHLKTINLVQQYEKYKAQFNHLAAVQMDLLNSESFNINIASLEYTQKNSSLKEEIEEIIEEIKDVHVNLEEKTESPQEIKDNMFVGEEEAASEESSIELLLSSDLISDMEEDVDVSESLNQTISVSLDVENFEDEEQSLNNLQNITTEKEYDDSFQFISYDD